MIKDGGGGVLPQVDSQFLAGLAGAAMSAAMPGGGAADAAGGAAGGGEAGAGGAAGAGASGPKGKANVVIIDQSKSAFGGGSMAGKVA